MEIFIELSLMKRVETEMHLNPIMEMVSNLYIGERLSEELRVPVRACCKGCFQIHFITSNTSL